MQMNVKKEGPGVQMTFDPAMVERIKREGFDGLVAAVPRVRTNQGSGTGEGGGINLQNSKKPL